MRVRHTLTFAAALLVGCAAPSEDDAAEDDLAEGEAAIVTDDPASAPVATEALRFRAACEQGTPITVAAVGDVLLHSSLQRQAYASPEGARTTWSAFAARFAEADLAYANFEGPAADGLTFGGPAPDPGRRFDGAVYAGFPHFNYHPSVLGDLRDAGFDVISTANNHSLDRKSAGADRTVDNVRASGLAFTGTRRAGDRASPWYAITEAKGVRVAWLACTFSTNGLPDPHRQVLGCYRDRREVVATVRELAGRADVDAVIVTPHWGDKEYTFQVAPKERALAKELVDAGATAILGSHPHVLQPWEKVQSQDGREALVAYSLGNFVSSQPELATKTSAIVYVGLTKPANGKAFVNGVRHEPIEMTRRPSTLRPAGREAGALVDRLLGPWNRVRTGEPVMTNPDCR